MELELELGLGLGLALPKHNPMKGFDLNHNGFEPNWTSDECCLDGKIHGTDKRGLAEAFEDRGGRHLKKSLLCWNDQPNEEDDGQRDRKKSSYTINKNEGEEENQLVGWPPIKSWRKKLLHQGRRIGKHGTVERGSRGSNSTYVKVKMEGVAIGRKIDLQNFRSYHTLRDTLIKMFAKCDQKCEGNNASYILLFQDRDGDWLLAGDVPWQTFIDSVCRMEIRNAG